MRFVIGNAKIDASIINKNSSWNMMGAGLAEARELLNDKTTKNSYRFSFLADGSASGPVLLKLLNTMGNSLTSIENKWTEKQLDAIIELRGSGATRQQLAHKLGINRNSLYKTLKAALFDNYNEQLESIVLALVFMDSKTAGKEQNE